jgi:hypothetical protein
MPGDFSFILALPSGNSQKDYANAEKYVILTKLYNAITI